MTGTVKRRMAWLAVGALLLTAASALEAKKKNPEDSLRTVQGTVTDAAENQVNGAIVQLKNTKTLQIRSFVTQEHGAYYFHGLSPNVDYEVRADFQGASSPTKTVSSFDSRKEVAINLKLEKK
ncbi:MAG TPA: carboxypeptidase-like regulatory domain-containing protein [Bryobacteraceae bacterium]|nr:carboxypeptidase-like regulatory domain-containing protein [Bryobacteraceae bacterium]